MPVRVVIVDDHDLFARALEAVLERDERVVVVGVATSGAEGIAVATAQRPDVVLMDAVMPEIDGFAATKVLRMCLPETGVVMLSGHDGADLRRRAADAGAVSYVTKDREPRELVEEIVGVGPPRDPVA